jgi:predicted transcriptional regulator
LPHFPRPRVVPLLVDINRDNLSIWGMEVHFTPEQDAQLSRIATHAGTDTERLVKDAALRLVEEKNRFSTAVREGVAQADRGELIDDDEVRLWLEDQERSRCGFAGHHEPSTT